MLMSVAFTRAAQNNPLDILAKAKHASGGAAWDSLGSVLTRMTIITGGLKGTAASWEDIRTGRGLTRFELGPMTGAQGFDGLAGWTQDSSKQVKPDEGEAAVQEAVNNAYRRSLAYWFPERWGGRIDYAGLKEEMTRCFHVIEIMPKGGRVFTIWIDAASFLFDRIVEKAAVDVQTTFFSDYRDIAGVKVPFSTRTTTGDERYDQFSTVDHIEFNVPLKDEMFRVPAPPAPDFGIAGDRTSTTIPFELYNNHIYARVKLNGEGPFEFICDTGGSNVVTPGLAAKLGLKPEGAVQGRGVGEKSEDIALARMKKIEVGEATLSDQVFAIFPLPSFDAVEGRPIQGLIGYEVFKRFVVRVDYEKSLLTLTLPAAFSYKGGGRAIPFVFNGQIPQVEGEIDGIPGKFDIDTGSRGSLTILAPFAEKHDLKTRYRAGLEAVTGWGVGGPARGLVTRAAVLRLGGVEIRNLVAELSLQRKGAFVDAYTAGNVGGGVLKRFNIVFDYSGKRLIFERNSNDALTDDYDKAGLWINSDKNVFQVMDVVAGGPAAEAGLKLGDAILAVDGKTPAELTLSAARARLRSDPAGTRIKLRVLSGKTTREVILILRDLLPPRP
jgi:hypothetical protein